MNGEQNSQNTILEEKIEKFNDYIEKYEEDLGLGYLIKPCSNEELFAYLQMDKTYVDGLSAEECCYIAIRLAEYELYLQRMKNKEANHVEWCKNELDKIVAKNIHNYSGGSWEMQKQRAINDNEYLVKVQDKLLYAKSRLKSLDGITFSIKTLLDQINNLKYIKYSIKTQGTQNESRY